MEATKVLNVDRIEAWADIVNRFTKKLSSWKANLLSIGGRLTLVKSVLGSLPIYFLSMFKEPEAVISKLESIRRRFFWSMKGDENKMVWIRWQKILSCKKDGGLGVGSIKAKNLDLMGK
nr:reverse transcriptase domain, reverse transcriptase zinc-binding domain protein [Tanacetum cinerariifolium]